LPSVDARRRRRSRWLVIIVRMVARTVPVPGRLEWMRSERVQSFVFTIKTRRKKE